MVQGIASFMGGSTREQQLRQQSKEQLLNSKTPIQKRRERRAGLKGGEGADSGIGKFATQLGVGVLPGAGVADVVGVFPDVEGGYEPSMLVNFQQAKRSFQEGNYKQAAAQGIFGALQGLGGAGDVALAATPFAPFALPVAVGAKTVSSVGKKLVQKFMPKEINLQEIGDKINKQKQRGLSASVGIDKSETTRSDYVVKGKEMKNVRYSDYKLEESEADKIMQEARKKHKSVTDKEGNQKPGVDLDEFNVGKFDGITMYTRNIVVKPEELKGIKGYQGEEKRVKTPSGEDSQKLKDLKESIAKEGYKPYSNPNIIVNHKGEPFVLEGNHRIQEAIDSGRPTIAVDIQYLTTGYRADGPLNPQKLIDENPLTEADLVQHQKLYDEFNFAGKKMQAKEQARYEKEKGIASLPKEPFNKIFIKGPFDRLIASGKKTLETRGNRLPEKYIGKPLVMKNEKNEAVGEVTFKGSRKIETKEEFDSLRNQHLVEEGSPFDFGNRKQTYVWEVDNVKKYSEPQKIEPMKGQAPIQMQGAVKTQEGIAALPKEQGATKVENMLKPKTEIRSEGGFKFAPEKIKQNVQLQKVRIAKMNEGKTPAGEPLNERIEIKAPEGSNLPNFVVGKIKPKDWQERTEKLLSDEEINRASKWYKEVYEYFNKIPGVKNDAEAKNLAQAWFAGQQNASPSEALKNVLSIRQLLKEGKTPDEILNMEKIPYGGLEPANRAILAVLTDTEVKGVGQKISDFRDALDNKNVRSFMGDDVVGGQPFVVDIHTGRDTGLVDKTLLNFLEKKGYKIPKNIKTDFDAGVPPAKYENRSVFGNELTEYLNSVNWKGRSDWEPAEIQAIGWTGLTNFYGGVNTAGNITDTLNINIQRISMEAKPGKGSPWDSMFGKDFSELSVEKQTQINNEVTEKAIEMVAKSENIDLSSTVFGTGGWQSLVNPSTIQQAMLTRDKAKRVAAKLGMLLNQDEVWVNSVKALTKNPENIAIDIIEEGSVNFKNSEYINKMFTDLFERTDGLIKGFQPIETLNNEVGIRIIITKEAMKNFGKKNKLNLKKVQDRIENLDINNLLKDYDFKMRYGIVESELDILSNNWRKNKDGTDYKKNYLPRGDDPRTSQDGKDFDLDRQELTDFFRQKIRDAQGVKTPNEEVVEIIEDPPPINKKAFGGFVESSNYDHYRII